MDRYLNLCLNHGEVNPKTGHPDSACGAHFTKDKSEGCKIHAGYFCIKRHAWTCCELGEMNVPGCQESNHETALWPEDKAKLHFFPKPQFNPGLTKLSKAQPIAKQVASIAHQICKCDYFKKIEQYENVASKFHLLKIKRENAKDDTRACLNWGCERHFTESHNGPYSLKELKVSPNVCLCHPGKWDHGYNGHRTMNEFINEFQQEAKDVDKRKIQWRPHWTCCDGDWEAKGCKRMTHRGPLVEEGETARDYVWPDIRVKLYFKKTVSKKWKKNLEMYEYDEDKVKRICHKFFSGGNVKIILKLIFFIFRNLVGIFLNCAIN